MWLDGEIWARSDQTLTVDLSLGVQVNDKDIRKSTHQEAVMALIAPTFEIILEVRHDPPPPGLEEYKIYKAPGEKLGISIKGGARGLPGNPLDHTDEGIFISKVKCFKRI